MRSFKFSWEYDCFEIRTTESASSGMPYIELVKWVNEDATTRSYCYTVAYYKWDSEGGDWVFVGIRPFDDISGTQVSEIWDQMGAITRMFIDWYMKNRDEEVPL